MDDARARVHAARASAGVLVSMLDGASVSEGHAVQHRTLENARSICGGLIRELDAALEGELAVSPPVVNVVHDFEYAWQKLLDSNHGPEARKIAFDLVALAYGCETK